MEIKQKSCVVLIHGMWSTPTVFDEMKAFFIKLGYQVHTPSLPHHLPKQDMSEHMLEQLAKVSFEVYVESILQFVDSLNSRIILVGHSMGGLIAQAVASRRDCQGLILLSSAAPAGINGWSWSVIRTFGKNFFKFPLWRTTTELSFNNIRYGVANSQSTAIQEEITQMATYESGRVTWQLGMWFLYKKPKNFVDFEQTKCPILIIGGDQDKITPIKIQQRLKAKYNQRATLKVIANACHWTVKGRFFETISQSINDWLVTNSAN